MRSRQYGLILALAEQLPQGSRYKAAREDDEEYVEQMREAYIQQIERFEKDPEAQARASAPGAAGWDTHREGLAAIQDELRLLREATIAVGGGKAGRVEPTPRPLTRLVQMVQSASITKRRRKHESIVDTFLPRKRSSRREP